ncbi:PREDICTED: uncharacterized protein LOC109581322 [Amphimedon queenslandica]|uniref:Protein kinase domain-containing protein n=1 Tax=Amphimedon queenslandica TaxID=400682 RepID=A0AAN0J1K5_AMPQE|nr:PREDICTED: uncharacterized protein LOC109581322 [Amphimedon queenslandica]|eukprot:XP_019850919.1 PREDICTED: uncharacterized protein LOC109581322 [Amphimedon queenslandica]
MALRMSALKAATTSFNYEPAERKLHSTVIVGDCLYMWGGEKDDLGSGLEDHNIETERKNSSVVEVLHLPTGRWEQKPTTGDPPLGIVNYVAVAIGNEIFYYGGYCSHGRYDDNVLYSLNVDTLKWRKVVPNNPENGPKEKYGCGMIAVKIEGEDYLVIIEPGSNCIYYFRVATGQWILPKITGDDITGIDELISIDDTSAILLKEHFVCRLTFAKGSVVCVNIHVSLPQDLYMPMLSPKVVLASPLAINLLAIGDKICMTLDVIYNKLNWKKVGVPNVVKNRICHSLSVWNEGTTNTWLIMFGGDRASDTISETIFLNIRYNKRGDISVKTYSLRQYQEEMRKRRRPFEQEISQKGERDSTIEERHQQEIQQLHLQMEERDQQAREREREMERQLQEMERELQQKIQELCIQNDDMERQFREREQQLQQQLKQSQQELEEKDRQLEEQQSAWVVNGDEIRMTETVLGNGGYGEVRVAQFRGLRVSDYGSANLQNLIATTENPGNRVYSAPEAGNPRKHSPAMDVFSYGVLLIEMSICAIPQPGNRRQDVNSIRRAGLKGLVQRCVMDNCELRPKMSDIINELTQSI